MNATRCHRQLPPLPLHRLRRGVPVECFHADEERTYIDPEVCIDCGACIPACPVHAIYEVIDMPDDQRRWIKMNAERARALPVVYAKQEPLPTAAARRAQLGF